MTNIEKLALDLCRMKHCDQILAALPLILPKIVTAKTKEKEVKQND